MASKLPDGEIAQARNLAVDCLPVRVRPRVGLQRHHPAPALRMRRPQEAWFNIALELPRLISLDARQQLFFQLSTALLEPLDLRLGPAALEELDDLAVIVTKRVEARVRGHQPAHGRFTLREPFQQWSDAFDHFVGPYLQGIEQYRRSHLRLARDAFPGARFED
jgi:hypothetical protein